MARRKKDELYPAIRPYRSGFLEVGDGHRLYYEECGNPKGYPILYVHGGPGAGCGAGARRCFDPRKWRIILFDQRGAGRSRPYANIHANTTRHLVNDILKLLDHLKVEKAVLFGGSWGSTLSLSYAIRHPKTVSGMILRGVWLATREELEDYNKGISTTRFPEIWKRFISFVPKKHRNAPSRYYYEKMLRGTPEERKRFAFEWAYYETARLYLAPPSEKALQREIYSDNYESLSVLEAHYIIHGCFMEEGHILKNVKRIPDVPISIIHGRYDDVCPVKSALELARALPSSNLHIVVAGHSRTDPEIRKKLVTETNAMFQKISRRKKK